MSDPTYRIDVRHDPSGPTGFTWTAEVYRLSDDSLVSVKNGASKDDVGERAVQAVYQLTHEQQPPFTVYVDDDGSPVEGHRATTPDAALCRDCGGAGEKWGEPCPSCSGVEGHSVKA